MLKDSGYNVPEIRRMTNDHDNNIGLKIAVSMVLFPESMYFRLFQMGYHGWMLDFHQKFC
ncbi:MAG: hypothetical protein WAZ77_07880 [Candidatus Nitrosopolaris sp.]